jgi:exoribonuclease R
VARSSAPGRRARRPTVPVGARHLLHGATVDFAALRTELQVPQAFPKTVEAAAADVAAHHSPTAADYTVATDLDLVTVDPTGSRDLDQAFALERHGDGFRLWYAIADVAAFVRSGDAVDAEAWRRGETRYCPDRSIPLHPVSLSEGATSLLPEKIRPAALWRIDLDGAGEIVPGGVEVRRSLVRSRAQLSYDGLTDLLRTRKAPAPAALLPVVGQLRLEAARRRHAIDLPIPEQRVVPADPGDPNGRYTVEFRQPLDVETWNAQLSLLTGMAAADLMLDGGVGLLRTLPTPPSGSVDRLRAAALALGVPWPEAEAVGDVLASLDPTRPAAAAFASLSAELLRGAGYRAFDGEPPPPDERGHAGIAAPYAHVTAPLRRLADRYATEVCLALCKGAKVPDWAASALPALPDEMASSSKAAHGLERACVDLAEAWLLRPRVGEVFTAAVVDSGHERGTVVLADPAVRARCDGPSLPLGERVEVRLEVADPASRDVRFTFPA